jgi:hypothetical protein
MRCKSYFVLKASVIFLLLFSSNYLISKDKQPITVDGIEGLTLDDEVPLVSITSQFSVAGLKVIPTDLSLSYINEQFSIYGTASVLIETDTLDVGLGDQDQPGIVIQNEILESVNFSLTTDFSIKAIEFSPNDMTFIWDKASDQYQISGQSTIDVDDEELSISLGSTDDPGLIIGNSSIESLKMSITADFEMKGLSFTSDDLGFFWEKSSNEFKIHGDTETTFDGSTLSVNLGTEDAPGLSISSGAVEEINMSITDDFEMKGLSFTSDDLGFFWAKSSNEFKIHGDTETTFDGSTLSVNLGTEDAPGLSISSGVVEEINMSITDDFEMKGLNFKSDDLGFFWEKSSNEFKIHGDTETTFDGSTLSVNLGKEDAPGLSISSGVVEEINMSITDDFEMKGLNFKSDDLGFFFEKSSNEFKIHGDTETTFDGSTLSVNLGTEDAPGLSISSGVVEEINMSITDDFEMKGLNFKSDDLGFFFEKSSNEFKIHGDTETTFDGSTLSVNLGTEEEPGLKIKSGVVKEINMSVSGNFDLKGITFEPSDLTFELRSGKNFILYGEASTTFEGESIDISLGDVNDAGIDIQSGKLEKVNLDLTADFKLKTMEFEADDLTYKWNKSKEHYEMYGNTKATFDGESIDVGLGSSSSPGIVIKNKTLEKVNMSISGDFKMKEFTFKPNDLTFQYDKSQSHYELYGSAKFTLEGHDATISLGTDANPGLVFKSSELRHINLSITEDFELKGLTVKTSDLGVVWEKSTDYFNFHGDIDLEFSSEKIDADLGTASKPGMQFRKAKLHSFNANINSDFKLGNLEVTAKDVDVKYSSNKFEINGNIEVDEVWSVAVELGRNGQGGLEVLTSGRDKIKVDDFTIDVEHVDLGAIDFKELKISFRNDVIHEADIKVSFPPGYEVDADMTFAGNPARLNSIDISFDATNFDTAIPVGDTGIDIVHIEGGMFNLADPSKYVTLRTQGSSIRTHGVYFKGSVAFTFGGPARIGSEETALLYQRDDIFISGTEADLSASLLIGAYRHSTNSWRSLLGEGDITLKLVWNRYYKISAYMKIPSDPLVSFNADAKLSRSGNFDALLDVKLKVPHKVPIVGGKTLGRVDGGIRYNRRDLNGSYAAGWSSYHFFGTHHFGGRYKFGDRKVDVIGSGTVRSIESQIKREVGEAPPIVDLPSSARPDDAKKSSAFNNEPIEWETDIRTFIIPEGKSSMLIELDFAQEMSQAYLSMIGPNGFYDIYQIEKTEQGPELAPLAEIKGLVNLIEGDSAANLLVINHEPEDEFASNEFSSLLPGQYDFMMAFPADEKPDSLGIRVSYFEPESIVNISAELTDAESYQVDMNYWANTPDSTSVSLYWNDTLSHSGYHIATLDYGTLDEEGWGSISLDFDPEQVAHKDSIYFYGVLQDSSSVPVYSAFSDVLVHQAAISGTLSIEDADDDPLFSGYMFYIDENGDGFHDTALSGGFEPISITNSEGDFHFNGLEIGSTYSIRLLVPYGYSIASDSQLVQEITYTGEPIEMSFKIIKD